MNSPVLDQANILKSGTGELRLNLGGRDKPIEGFMTVDLFEGPGVDIRCDCADLKQFRDQSVSEIYASHILEHWPHVQTIKVLSEWHRILKPNARAYIAVPDFQAAVEVFKKDGFTALTQHLLWGDQGYDKAFHYAGFTYPYLADKVIKAGFSDIKRVRFLPYGLTDCSRLVDTIYEIPLSLNIEAIA